MRVLVGDVSHCHQIGYLLAKMSQLGAGLDPEPSVINLHSLYY